MASWPVSRQRLVLTIRYGYSIGRAACLAFIRWRQLPIPNECFHERRTKIDIVFEKVVEHVDAEVKQCPVCDATVKGRFPADMHGPLQ